jgi:DNA-binding NtrC family response regulator
VTETLHEGGYRVTEVHNAAAAMDALSCSAAPFAVVLLDMRLPDSGDLSVLAAMHTMRPATPVIVMTAHGSPELAQDARHLGAFAIVDKPFEMTDLVPLIERALGGIPIERRL